MSKKLPKTLEDELKRHDLAINIVTRHDYAHGARTANEIVRELKKIRANKEKNNVVSD